MTIRLLVLCILVAAIDIRRFTNLPGDPIVIQRTEQLDASLTATGPLVVGHYPGRSQ